MTGDRAIVVGGGIIGAACAYYLAKDGWNVTLLERDEFGRGCSSENCGLLAFSHVLPLNMPGAVRKTLKAFFRGGSPLYVKPRISPALWAWLIQFARHCNKDAMLASARARANLLSASRQLYDQMQEEEHLDCEREHRGCLFVFRTREALDGHEKTLRLLRDEFGTKAARYDDDELVAFEPAIAPGVASGGWHYLGDAHLRPEKLLTELRRILEERGVTIHEHCHVSEFVRDGDRSVVARTSVGDHDGVVFVLATGAVTPQWARPLGCRIPIQPGKGYSITMPRPAVCPKRPIIFDEEKVAVTPMQTGYRLGSTMEFSGYDETLNRRRLQLLVDGARRYLREPTAQPVESEWYGWRPMTYDGLPIIDRSPSLRNVYIAAGHNMLGTTLAPATGRLIADLVSGTSPHIDPHPYSIERFS
jgi:D-amino-acid dehydrogenase